MRTAPVVLALGLALAARASAPVRPTAATVLFANHNYPDDFLLATEVLRRADPTLEARVAYARGDRTLIELCDGYAGCIGPEGVAVDASHPVRIVPSAIGCVVNGREDEHFRDVAHRYAAAYNRAIVALEATGVGGEPSVPDNNQMQRTRPAQATKPRH